MDEHADLIADAGASAISDDFFRSADFLLAEGATHTLAITTTPGRLRIPLIVRDIEGTGARDAISPYGYPSGVLDGEPLDLTQLDLSGSGLVSMFIRDRVGGRCFTGGTLRAPIYGWDPQLPDRRGDTFKKHVRRNERRGIVVTTTRGPDVEPAVVGQFEALYADTMLRAAASPRYFFPQKYIEQCLQFSDTWLFTAHTADGEPAAASLAVRSDSRLHYFLEGTEDRFLAWSPGKNCVQHALALASELRMPINFGGGLTPDDGIATFKRSFCNTEDRFVTHEIVCDPPAYAELSRGAGGAGGFFPAYRNLGS